MTTGVSAVKKSSRQEVEPRREPAPFRPGRAIENRPSLCDVVHGFALNDRFR